MGPGSTALPAAVPVPLPRRRRSELAFLPGALEVIDTPASPAARYTAGTIAAFLVVAVGWSCLGQVDIIATAPGRVVPAGRTKVVQPLEAGVVKAILVQDGDHVRAGQVLVTLDVVTAAAERDRLARDLRQARLETAGLTALRQDLASGAGPDGFVAPEGVPASEAEIERAAIAARWNEQQAKVAGLEQQIAGKRAEAAENDATLLKLEAALPLLQQKRDLYRSLLNVQFTNKVAWLEAEQGYSDQAHELAVRRSHAGAVAAEQAALVRQLAQARAGYAHDVLKQLAEAEQKQGELEQQYAAAAHRARQTVLAAPIDGTVQQLAIHTVGGVVTPAEQLMAVVPDAGPVLVEAMVPNREAGFVRAGQAVEVKVEAFPFTRYGLLHGHVLDVSRDAVSGGQKPGRSDGDGEHAGGGNTLQEDLAGYVAHVALERASLRVDGREEALRPGMTVTAEIKTGKRSIISYIVSPITRKIKEFGRER